MYRVYDTFEECCYATKEAEKVKKRNPTAPPERWLLVAVHDDMPEDIVSENIVVVKPNSNSELHLYVSYNLNELRSHRYAQSIQKARTLYAEKYNVRIVRVAGVFGNKKTLELLLGCRIS